MSNIFYRVDYRVGKAVYLSSDTPSFWHITWDISDVAFFGSLGEAKSWIRDIHG